MLNKSPDLYLNEKVAYLRNAAKVADLAGDTLKAARLTEAAEQYARMAAESEQLAMVTSDRKTDR